ncbi:MAG TPA: endonuclease domain-containing protein [Stellaceae bacterium]|nr:endonuclease domain-containing protein [Stellaceae bacterium]
MAPPPRTRRARELRRKATDAENRLWAALREGFPELRFRRQHPIAIYFADLACPSRKLVIEIDGSQHMSQVEADARRTAVLAHHGYRAIRFWSNEVLQNIDGVFRVIEEELTRR